MKKNKTAKKNKTIELNKSELNKSDPLHTIILCALPLITTIIFHTLKLTDESSVRFIIRLALMVLAMYGVYLSYTKKWSVNKAVTLIILAGILIRCGYTAYTDIRVRNHDVGSISSDGDGHWGYIYQIMTGHLPPSNENQFYQPPLYYIVSSFFIRAARLITHKGDWTQLIYIAQTVSCTCSVIALVTIEKIMNALNIDKRSQIVPAALCAFYPAVVMMSGRINNDAMVFMFTMLALFFTLRWHQTLHIKYILCIAFSIGFGMMTKINCGVTAFITGPIMIYHFIKVLRSKDRQRIKTIIIQLSVFAIICFPLGLWYPVRNLILFDQPLNFVLDLGKNNAVYTGEASFSERWISFPLFHFAQQPYMQVVDDTNIWMGLIKTGVHGEFTWNNLPNIFAWSIEYVHILLMILSLIAIICTIFRNKTIDKTQKWSVFWVWALFAAAYIQFNIAYPYMCTADFRYVYPAQTAAAIFIAYLLKYLYEHKDNNLCKYTLYTGICTVALFCCMSIIHFC